jgi:hypothetical protein
MSWSNNNLAHVHTWMALRVLGQSSKTFDASEQVKVREFEFWVEGDSAAMRSQKARALATQLDNAFRLYQGADYESGYSKVKAINALAAVLRNGERTMAELGDEADACYFFAGEVHRG